MTISTQSRRGSKHGGKSTTDATYEKPGVSSAIIGPREIVLCMDVSDSISAGELESMVNGLGGCLSDQSLIPTDGTVSVVLVAYGDTTATALDRTPVTPDNLANVILPALQGLLADRVVAGGGFDLSGALEDAFAILGAASVSDKHILIVGSGTADDPDASATLLSGWAVATGGFFGTGVACPNSVGLRVERMGGGNGRVYTIVYRVVMDDGAVYAVTPACGGSR